MRSAFLRPDCSLGAEAQPPKSCFLSILVISNYIGVNQLCFLCGSWALLLFWETPQIRANDGFLKAVATAYRANRDAIPGGAFDFTYSQGNVGEIEHLTQPPLDSWATTPGKLLFVGSDALFELTFSMDTMAKNATSVGDRSFSTGSLQSYQAIRNSRCTLRDFAAVRPGERQWTHSLQMTAGPKEYDSCLIFPLDLSATTPVDHDLPQDVERALESRNGWSVESTREVVRTEGGDLQKVVFVTPFGKREYQIDLSRGAVPVRIADVPKDRSALSIVFAQDKLQQAPGGSWLPYRRRIFAGGLGRVLEITKADWQPPAKSRFRMNFERPLRIFNRANGEVYNNAKSIDLNALPKPDGVAKMIPERTVTPPPAVPLREPSSYYGWGIAVGSLILAGSVIVAVRKRTVK